MEKNRDKLYSFLKKYFLLSKVDDNTNIFEMGFVNSLFSMQLILFMEKEFGIVVEVSDMDMENFNTIGHMLEFIDKKTTP